MSAIDMILLYDYYGDLLTDRQRECFEMRYYQDLSLGEIGEELGISRRYVTKLLKPLIDQDIVKRAYILDMDKLEETYGSMNGSFNSKEHSANFLIQNMIVDEHK
mgnify:CR=1 FL=1